MLEGEKQLLGERVLPDEKLLPGGIKNNLNGSISVSFIEKGSSAFFLLLKRVLIVAKTDG